MQIDPSTDILGTQAAPKKAFSGHFRRILKRRSATCESRSRPPPLSFLVKLCVIVLRTHSCHPPKFQLNPKHNDGVLIFPHFAPAACLQLLLAACCLLLLLLLAKLVRSAVDTKQATMGSKRAKNTCLSTPSGLGGGGGAKTKRIKKPRPG